MQLLNDEHACMPAVASSCPQHCMLAPCLHRTALPGQYFLPWQHMQLAAMAATAAVPLQQPTHNLVDMVGHGKFSWCSGESSGEGGGWLEFNRCCVCSHCIRGGCHSAACRCPRLGIPYSDYDGAACARVTGLQLTWEGRWIRWCPMSLSLAGGVGEGSDV
jgi:hypothetical protein